jgi:hypothetical protein
MGTSTQSVETVTIVDLGNDIQITYSVSGYVYTLNKLSLKVKQTDKFVYITNGDGFNNLPSNQVIPLHYTTVSSPVYASNDLLFDGLMGFVSSVSLGGGGAGGGGNNTWTSFQDFNATPTVGTKNITITGSNFPIEDGHVALGSVVKIDSAGNKETLNISQVTVSGGVITLPKIDDFVAGDTVDVALFAGDKAYNEALDANVVVVLNQDSEKWTSPEHLVDISAQAAATLYYVVPMEGYKDLSTHWKFSNSNAGDTITMTLWATNNADADGTAVTDWVDITGDYLTKTLTVTNGTIEFAEVLENLFFLKVMVRLVVVSAGATNAADIYIKKKAL